MGNSPSSSASSSSCSSSSSSPQQSALFDPSLVPNVACPLCPLASAYTTCTAHSEHPASSPEENIAFHKGTIISAEVAEILNLPHYFIGWRLCFHHDMILTQKLHKKTLVAKSGKPIKSVKAQKKQQNEMKEPIQALEHLQVQEEAAPSSPSASAAGPSSPPSCEPEAVEASSAQVQVQVEEVKEGDRPIHIKHTKAKGKFVMSELLSNTATSSTISLKPIGHLRSCFLEKNGTPRQGAFSPYSRAYLDIVEPDNPTSAVDGLEVYSHVWLLFLFHDNKNTVVRAKVQPPRLNGKKVGVYSTRSPHRPNPVGLSLVKLDRIEKNRIFFSGLDLIDGTPIIDVKPYHPADSPHFFDLHSNYFHSFSQQPITAAPASSSSSSSSLLPEGNNATIPDWLQDAIEKQMSVEFTPESLQQITSLVPRLHFYHSLEEIQSAIFEVLRSDIRSVLMKSKHGSGGMYGFCLDNLNIIYTALSAADSNETRESIGAISFPSAAAFSSENKADVARVMRVEFWDNYKKKPSKKSNLDQSTGVRSQLHH